MTRSAVILRNVASNWSGFAVNAIVMLFLTPFVLEQIGQTRYGVWILISSIIGHYGMLDLGFRAGVNQFLTRSLAAHDYTRASAVLSTAVLALSLLGAAMLAITGIAAYLIPIIFDLPSATEHEAFWCLLLVGGAAAFQCAFSPFSAVFVAKQRFDLSNLIGIFTRLLSALFVLIALNLGHGLVGLAAATAGVTMLGQIMRWAVARRIAPQLTVILSRASKEELRRIGSFGLWNFLITVSAYVYRYLQPLLIAAFMPVAAVGHYALAAGLWHQISGIFAPVGQVLYPVAAELDVRGERATLQRLYTDGSRLMVLLVWPTVLIGYVWAEDFYRLWIGEQYLTGTPFTSVATLLQIMLIATAVGYTSNIAGQILLGAGYIRELALLQTCGAFANALATILLIPHLGLAAVAIANVVSAVIVDLVGIPFVAKRKAGLDLIGFLRLTFVRLFPMATLLFLFFWLLDVRFDANQWFDLMLQGATAGLLTASVVLILGVTAGERQRFVFDPIRRLLGRNVQRPSV